jgi:hypothetical protein
MRPILILIVLCLLTACQRTPRDPIISYEQAGQFTIPIQLRVVKIFETVRLSYVDARVSYLIEIERLDGREAGKVMTFPFAAWETGSPPAFSEGDTLTVAPASWVPAARKRTRDMQLPGAR